MRKQLKPFFLIFWSRDPDGTQHNQGDSIDQLYPGINGPTSRAAIRNADNDLWQIVDYLKANNLDRNTDIIVVADHGFSTISKREVAFAGTPTKSYAAGKTYLDVKQGQLPPGFLALDGLIAGKPETQFSAAEEPDWKAVRDACLVLFNQSKHLRVAVTLALAPGPFARCASATAPDFTFLRMFSLLVFGATQCED